MTTVSVDSFGYELARIAAEACGGQPPHDPLLGAVRSLLVADAAIVITRDPTSGRLGVQGMHGYDEHAIHLMTSPTLLARDPALRSIDQDRSRPPIRWWYDPDYVYETSDSATKYLSPAGFNGGLTIRCFSENGVHVGDVHTSTRAILEPSPQQVNALARSLPAMAALLVHAPTRPPTEVARFESGRVTSRLSDLPHAELKRLSDLFACATTRHPWSFRQQGRDGTWYRIENSGPAHAPTVRVLREYLPYRITVRELAVLDALCAGLTNAEIATRLFVSERTVAHHVERILDKLTVSTRAAAVAVAVDEGLRLAPPAR